MKKTVMGIALIVLALFILFKDSLGLSGIPFWPLCWGLGFGILAIDSLLEKSWYGAIFLGVLSFAGFNKIFGWLDVSFWTLLVVTILLMIGLKLILNPKMNLVYISTKGKSKSKADKIKTEVIDGVFSEHSDEHHDGASEISRDSGSDTVFGSNTRYINGDFVDTGGDIVFASSNLYFDNATIIGDKAVYSGDAVFSTVKLFVPKHWKVTFSGDKVFSSIKCPSSGQPTDKTLELTGDFVFSNVEVHYI